MEKIKRNSFYVVAAIFGLALYYSFGSTSAINSYLFIGVAVVAGLITIKTSKHLTINEK